ncbi:accessory gene regulator B family protein, partial [Roseburia intestinalis]
MIAKFAKKINEILIQKGIVQKEDAELYRYGIENGIVVAGKLLASGIFGIVTGRPGLVLVFLLFYAS